MVKLQKFCAVLLMGGLVLLLTACVSLDETQAVDGEEGASIERIQKESGEAAEAITDFARQQRDDYEQQLATELDELQNQVDTLKAQAEDASKETQEGLNKEIAALEEEIETLRQDLETLQTASEAAWEDLSQGMGLALDELQKAYEEASSRFE